MARTVADVQCYALTDRAVALLICNEASQRDAIDGDW